MIVLKKLILNMNNFNLLSDLETVKREPKERTWKFWVIFWSLAATFLISWFLFLEYKNSNWIEIANFFSPVLKVAPIAEKQKTELQSIFKIASIISETEEVQTFLILLQNNLELRPGGGFIGFLRF